VGCVLYFLVCGKTPFAPGPEVETFSCLLNETSRRIRYNVYDIPADVSYSARTLIKRLLSPSPSDRPSAEEALKDNFFMHGDMYMFRPISLPVFIPGQFPLPKRSGCPVTICRPIPVCIPGQLVQQILPDHTPDNSAACTALTARSTCPIRNCNSPANSVRAGNPLPQSLYIRADGEEPQPKAAKMSMAESETEI
jgi:serine/threonine protein kinase